VRVRLLTASRAGGQGDITLTGDSVGNRSLRCMLHEEIILKMYPKGVGLTAWLTIRRRGEMEPRDP
jgi:hypothetical protein